MSQTGRSHRFSKSHCYPDFFLPGQSKSLVMNFPYPLSSSTQAYVVVQHCCSVFSEPSVKENGELKNKEKLSGVIDVGRQNVTGNAAKMWGKARSGRA